MNTETTAQLAREDAAAHVFKHRDTLMPFVVLPICSEEDWKAGYINFCPRCGRRVEHLESSSTTFDCHECNATSEVYIYANESEEDEE
jgi:DNA-directed RNA polymerase subunit RPC12/RpoP